MSNPTHEFMFDTSFGFGEESVFTQIDQDESPPFPPDLGYFLFLTEETFFLLNGQNLTLL